MNIFFTSFRPMKLGVLDTLQYDISILIFVIHKHYKSVYYIKVPIS